MLSCCGNNDNELVRVQRAKPYRYGVASTRLQHANLRVVHYGVFFQVCRANGVGFDVAEREGSIFMLLDGVRREHLALLTAYDTLETALGAFARDLNLIAHELSSPHAAGRTNFHAILRDIDAVYRLALENAEQLAPSYAQLLARVSASSAPAAAASPAAAKS